MTTDQIKMMNPNTVNCPMFYNNREKNIAVKIYENASVLVNEELGKNPWGVSFTRQFDMSNDSEIFSDNTLENLRSEGYRLDNQNHFVKSDTEDKYLPLYEAKFLQQYDHRFGTFEAVDEEKRFGRRAATKSVSSTEKEDPEFDILPRYWVKESEFIKKKSNMDWDKDWILALRRYIRTTTDARPAMGTLAPFEPFGDSVILTTFDTDDASKDAILFNTIYNSFVFDFSLQQSTSSAAISYYILKQLPMPSPDRIKEQNLIMRGNKMNLAEFLIEQGLYLNWTSRRLNSLKNEFDFDGPIVWNESERRKRKARIDAAIAHLYGLDKDEFRYIVNSFDILKNQEVEKFGEFDMRNKGLEYFEDMKVI